MDFKDATDRLLGVSQQELADALGVSLQHFRQMRLSADSSGRRPPPPGWRSVLARLLRAHAEEDHRSADELERGADRGP